MEENGNRETSKDSSHAYDSDSCRDEKDMESVESEDDEIFHECKNDHEGDVQITSKRAETTEYDPQLPGTPIEERIGNIQIIEEQNSGDLIASTERSAISDLETKTEAAPQNLKTTEETKPNEYSGNVRYCDLCKDSNLYILSSSYCINCEESYCTDCTNIHRSQKATKEHEISHPKQKDALFICETCRSLGIKNPAVASCKECAEIYCDTCSSAHKRQKATKGHSILSLSALSERGTCEPCEENEHSNKEASHLCLDCDEVQCYDCFFVHSKQKATKEHLIVCALEIDDQNGCHVCYKTDGKRNNAVMYCRACSVKLCIECAGIHRQDPPTGDHKVLEIPNKVANVTETRMEPPLINDMTRRDKSAGLKDNDRSVEDEMKPGTPCRVGQVKLDFVCLAWEPPKQLLQDSSSCYQLRYKEATSSSKWSFYPDVTSQNTIILSNLKSGTKYVFQVRMVSDEKEGPYSDISDAVDTIHSAAARILDFMYNVDRPDVEMPLKKLPLQENKKARDVKGKTRKLIIGEDKKTNSKERTIMLIGATGTGKTTLVDGMINYILGVNWSDPYRLTLVDLQEDEMGKDVNQAFSQTQWITCYTIHPLQDSRLDYTLNIIDTPGFGDTRGIERDREIIEQIRTLFSKDGETGIVFIDAVCFLIKAPDARLTPTQMYIFNAIMSLFGQDIENNFCMLVTFADGKRPPVLSALKEAKLPHEQHFPFNNSGLFAENAGENASNFSAMFWEMGCESFKMFFKKLKSMDTKSLRQTRDVLEQRELIELSMENLQPKLDAGLNKVEELRIEIRILEDFKTQIEANSDFAYRVTETEQKQIELPIGQHVTNCLNCHITCHKDCKIANDEKKRKCKAMDQNGYCTQCPMGCFWDMHRNTPYIFEYITVEKQKTYTEKLEKYRRAQDENMTRQTVVERMQEELFGLEYDILSLMEKINQCNNILRQIALRPDPLSVVEHIDLLIESEKLEKRAGFQGRIASLLQCHRRATIGEDVERFTTSFTDTKKIVTAQVFFSSERKKNKKKKGKTGIFHSVVNYFQE